MTSDPIGLVRPYRMALAGLLALVAISAGAEALGLVVLSALLSVIVPGAAAATGDAMGGLRRLAEDFAGQLLILLGVVYVMKSLVALWVTHASFDIGLRMADAWSLRLVRGYLTAPLPRLTRQQGSLLFMVLSEPARVGVGLASGGLLAQNVLSAISVYAALLVLSPLLTLGVTLMAGIAVLVVMLLSRYAQQLAVRRTLIADEENSYFAEMLSAIKQLRLFSLESQAERGAAEHLERHRRVLRTSMVLASSPRLLIEIVFLLGLAGLLGLVMPRIGGSAALADAGLFVAAAFRLLPSLTASAGTWVQLQQVLPGLGQIAGELALLETRDGEEREGGRTIEFAERIVVDDVRFSYPGREEALRGLDLEIPRGSFVGIVGASGSGKSTLVDLLCAFYTPEDGQILIDGVDLRQIDRRAWRRKLGVVAQDNFLFSGTIRENILLLAPGADDASLERVMALVGADGFLRELPHGYDTRLGERGLRLSGGQRQRLALARVLLKRPEILIMDEATSGLDVGSDELLQEKLRELRGAMTMIVIAHRLTSVRRADDIYVLAEGRVIEHGSHEALLRRNGAYAEMWRTVRSGLASQVNDGVVPSARADASGGRRID